MNSMGPIQKDGIGIISTATRIRTHPRWHHAALCDDCALYDEDGWLPVWLFGNKKRDNSKSRNPTDPGETRIARWCRKHEQARRREAERLRIRDEDVVLDEEESTVIAKGVLEVIIRFEAIIRG